jgi:hypothetical protein
LGAKVVKRGQRTRGCDFEDGAAAEATAGSRVEAGTTNRRCSVEISIGVKRQRFLRVSAGPSAQFGWEQKLYIVVSLPAGVILKTVPHPFGQKPE